jgi:murein L,D-transpeptidase YcbB/YkuD
MTTSLLRIARRMDARRFVGAGMLVGLLGCTDGDDRSRQPAPPVPLPAASAVSAPIEIETVHVPVAEVASAIKAGLDQGHEAAFGALTSAERTQLRALYEAADYAPLWIDAAGHPSASARHTLTLLRGAAADGLEPADYRSAPLDVLVSTLATSAQPPPVSHLASFDLGVSAGTLRFLRHLHLGRVDPRSIGFRMTAPADSHDFAALLHSAVIDGRILETAEDLTPPLSLYRDLRGRLARYRSLAADPTLASGQPSAAAVRPGEWYADLGALHQRLVAFGDLPADTPLPPDSAPYEGALVEGVKRFQVRHGLEPDGILGKDSQAALYVPVARRVRQIELALERLRWLPHPSAGRLVLVNIPMFRLWAWDSSPASGAPSLGMDVIVGRALNTRTPVFVEDMRYLIFKPSWNVPPGILRREILPALARDPDYLRRREMDILWGAGGDTSPVAPTAENLALLRRGLLRVRQRPGPNNAMGLVKFIFPNDENVYMHDTPAQELFSRTRRDFSNGCVRLEKPLALAEWALNDQTEWTRDRIQGAVNGRQSRRVNLTQPIQVILFYVTAAVMPEDGTIRFAEDIYGHDVKLDAALTLLSAAP